MKPVNGQPHPDRRGIAERRCRNRHCPKCQSGWRLPSTSGWRVNPFSTSRYQLSSGILPKREMGRFAMPTAPVVPVNEYAGPSFEGFTFVLTNPGETNGKSWELNIVTQVPFANYTALFTGTWDGSGMGMGPNKGP